MSRVHIPTIVTCFDPLNTNSTPLLRTIFDAHLVGWHKNWRGSTPCDWHSEESGCLQCLNNKPWRRRPALSKVSCLHLSKVYSEHYLLSKTNVELNTCERGGDHLINCNQSSFLPAPCLFSTWPPPSYTPQGRREGWEGWFPSRPSQAGGWRWLVARSGCSVLCSAMGTQVDHGDWWGSRIVSATELTDDRCNIT